MFDEMGVCRKYSPDLILLNHRLELGKGEPHATTFLWEGAETYIDVHMTNPKPAPHNRAEALSRGLPPELYGSPWFLRDDEFPQLARIFNLHRKYRDILARGIVLPEAAYGPHAVSRGDSKTRLVTLRNLTWVPVVYQVALDQSIGLDAAGARKVRLFHPYEEILGKNLAASGTVVVTVHSFRTALLLVTTEPCSDPSLEKGPYHMVRDVPGTDVEITRGKARSRPAWDERRQPGPTTLRLAHRARSAVHRQAPENPTLNPRQE